MGTTLTGLTPATTYDALIKVTDNGPLGASLKTLTDGLGNDSALALSTGAASVTGTLSVSNTLTLSGYGSGTKTGTVAYNLAVDSSGNVIETAGGVVDGSGTANYVSKWSDPNTLTNSLIYDNGTNVGIGTTSPTEKLHIVSSSDVTVRLQRTGVRELNLSSAGITAGSEFLYLSSDYGALSTIVLTTNSAERMRITATGNVGIGTSSPEALLHVNKSAAGGEGGYIYLDNPAASTLSSNVGIKFGTSGGASFAGVYTGLIQNIVTDAGSGASALFFGTFDGATSAERLRITSEGNVGIGTSSPTEKLQVAGTGATGFSIRSNTSGDAFMRYYLDGVIVSDAYVDRSTSNLNIRTSQSNSSIIFSTSPSLTERLRITSAGDVGIGTSSPSARIHGFNDNFSNSQGFLFEGFRSTYDATSPVVYIKGNWEYNSLRATDPILKVAAYNDPNGFYILHNGNVGIGTSSPSVKLDVVGQVKAAGSDYHTFSAANSSAQIRLERTGTSTGVSYIGADNDGLKVFNSSFSELARFDTSGNLSITSGNLALSASGGIYFDNAASKYLDDYEVGTWTPTISFGNASVGVTYTTQSGKYVKVGNSVSVTCYVVLSNKGTSTGGAKVEGLPFTIFNNSANYSAASFYIDGNITYTGTMQGFGNINSTSIVVTEVTEAGTASDATNANFANNSSFMVSLTYFVS